MVFTIFDSLPVTGKVPVSPHIDGSFQFINVETNLENCHNIFHSNFVMSRPLRQNIITQRKGEILEKLYTTCNYVILDIDKVTNLQKILYVFKNLNINCNIFKSRSFSTKNNIKAVIKTKFTADFDTSKATLSYFSNILNEWCEIDSSSIRRTSFQAPTQNFDGSLLLITNGDDLDISLIENNIEKIESEPIYNINISLDYTFNYIKEVLKGQVRGPNNNSTYQISLPDEKTPFGYFVHPNVPYLIQHPNKEKSFSILQQYIKTKEGKEAVINSIESKFNDAFKLNSDIILNERYCKSFPLPKKHIAIKSPMGTGKSNFIEEMFDNGQTKTLLISVRKTLSLDFSNKYNIKNYMQHMQGEDRWTPGENFICQIDSLFKIDLKYFDVVVIDEFESFLLYCSNHLIENSNFIKTMSIIKKIFETKRLIVMDAFLNNVSLSKFFTDDIYLINNEYRDTQKVFWYEQKETFFSIIEEYSQQKSKNEIISISFCTLKDMETCSKILQNKGLKTFVISSKTDDITKEALFKLFQEEQCDKYDVILFSPVITVGVSILHNIKHHFHFDLGKSVDPISSIQMIKRSRKAEIVHIYCESKLSPTKIVNNDFNQLKSFIDIESGYLTKLGEFVNKFIEIKNFYIPSHYIAVRSLLKQQFTNVDIITGKINSKSYKQTKRIGNKTVEQITIINEEDIEENQVIRDCMINFSVDQSTAIDIYNEGLLFIEKLYNLYLVKKNIIKQEINNLVSKSPGLVFINTSKQLKWLMIASNINMQLQKTYSPKELKEFDNKTKLYLKGLGYKSKRCGMYLDNKYIQYIERI